MPIKTIKKTEARRYSDGHLWLEPVESFVYVGLTRLALDELGEVNFLELPQLGAKAVKEEVLFVLESNKASGDFVSAVDGIVEEVNTGLSDDLSLLNSSPEEQGWFCKLSQVPEAQMAELMSASQYEKWLRQ